MLIRFIQLSHFIILSINQFQIFQYSKLTYMLFSDKIEDQPKIRVVIRKRPLNRKQIAKSEQDVVEVLNSNQVIVRQQKAKVDLTKYVEEHQFKFDHSFHQKISNAEVYEECVRPIVQCAFLGAKVTCFAYGQTGSGKTYTMNGDAQNGVLGMYYLGASDIFRIRDQEFPSLDIYVSFYEIYCGKLFDLLNSRQILQAREDAKQNVNIIGLTTKRVTSPKQFMDVISYGSSVRITSQNSTNADSSRSHAIMQVDLRHGKKSHGKISFIDLAGCERGADTIDQNKQTKIDGAEINKSLLALKECIRALDLGKNHTPFRGSKLTMVLKDSFTGFCKTLMIGNISPGSGSCQNTLNTLRYADRVKELKKGGGGVSCQGMTKQQKLAKQLMLPRNGKVKLIITNESDQQQITPQQKNSSLAYYNKNPSPMYTPQLMAAQQPAKKPKYIIKDQNDRQKNNQTPLPYQNRKNIMSNEPNIHAQPLKSANNAVNKHNLNRNKSVIGRQKHLPNHSAVSNNTSWINNNRPAEVPLRSERTSLHHNFSQVIRKDLKDINVYVQKPQIILNHSEDSQWQSAVHKFKKWSPNANNFGEMSQLFQEMVGMIMKEQLQITELHKSLLMQEEKQHQQLIGLYHETQTDNKNNQQMFDYAERLTSFMEQRVKIYANIKSRAELYQLHLKQHQFCEARLMQFGEGFGQIQFSSINN